MAPSIEGTKSVFDALLSGLANWLAVCERSSQALARGLQGTEDWQKHGKPSKAVGSRMKDGVWWRVFQWCHQNQRRVESN
jgi:hypothetical protein